MCILSKQAYLRKVFATLIIVLVLQTATVTVALHWPSVDCLQAMKSAHAAECSDGTCGKHPK